MRPPKLAGQEQPYQVRSPSTMPSLNNEYDLHSHIKLSKKYDLPLEAIDISG